MGPDEQANATETDGPTDAPADPRPVHGMRWGIKASFIDYLRRMPDGRGSVSDGAMAVGNNEVFFHLDGDPVVDGDRIDWSFHGDARFSGHYGMLFVRVAHPTLVGTTESAVLSIADPTAGDPDARIPLVTVRLEREQVAEGTEIWTGTKVALTAEGVEIFNDVYPVGEPFEPLVVQLPAGLSA